MIMSEQQFGFGAVPPQQPTMGKEKMAPKATFDSITATGVVLDNFRHAKQNYDVAKKALDEAKGYVIAHIGEQISVGTNRFATNHFMLKTSVSKKYDVDASDMQGLNQALTVIAGLCGGDVASSLIKWKPSLNSNVYEKLSDDAKAQLDRFITLSYGSPTLSIEDL